MEKNKLVPMDATQFPGSFAPDLREDQRSYPKKRDWRSVLHCYFADGWDDISIWKSAVRLLPLNQPTYKFCKLTNTVH